MHDDTFFTPLPTPAEMASWDAASVSEFCIPEFTLMENASREAFHTLTRLIAPKARILVIMGSGNNGGDGAALARHLADAGHEVLVCHTKPLHALPETSALHATLAQRCGVQFVPIALQNGALSVPTRFLDIAAHPDVVVDALLGTGLKGELRDRERNLVNLVNALKHGATVISLDIPSGLDGLTGKPRPVAVIADHTVTFEAAKVGLAFPHAQAYTGTVHVRPIGIPKAAQKITPPSFRMLAPRKHAWPPYSATMHKGDAGRVLIIGGSKAFSGAPVLAALGALRAGCGLVTMLCPEGLCNALRAGFPEIMALPLAGTGAHAETWQGCMIPAVLDALTALPRHAAVVLGPGLGRSPATQELVRMVLEHKKRPGLVLDADGLFPLDTRSDGTHSYLLRHLREEDCITPHPGEAAHILGTVSGDIQTARVEAFRSLAGASKAVTVLKGAGTLIGQGDAPITIAPFAAPTLAVGGSGDVLSGVIAAHMATLRATCQPDSPNYSNIPLLAACLGVYLHGRAGELLAERYPSRGALAREIADAIPLAYPEG